MAKDMDAALTGDDLALAEQGVGHLLTWWRNQPGSSGFRGEQIGKLEMLLFKLNAINNFAYPYQCSDDMPEDVGAEPIMTINRPVVARSRAVAAARTTEAPQ
jgi:hypothetical protein